MSGFFREGEQPPSGTRCPVQVGATGVRVVGHCVDESLLRAAQPFMARVSGRAGCQGRGVWVSTIECSDCTPLMSSRAARRIRVSTSGCRDMSPEGILILAHCDDVEGL